MGLSDFLLIVEIRVGPNSQISLKSENPRKKTRAEQTSDFYFFKYHWIGADSGFVFFIFIVSEWSADFYFCKIHQIGAEY